MKVLQLISPSGPYGAESAMTTLADMGRDFGCESTVGIFKNSDKPCAEVARLASERSLPVEIFTCKGRFDLSLSRRLADYVKQQKLDMVHSHGLKTDVYAYFAARSAHVPIVATYHNGSEAWRKKLKWRCYRAVNLRMLKGFHKVIAVSEPIRNSLRESGLKAEQIEEIPNGVNLDTYRPDSVPPSEYIRGNGSLTVGFVGRLVPEKGTVQFLQAAKDVIQKHPKTTFWLIGAGPHRPALEQMARDLDSTDYIRFAGVQQDMPAVYAALDIVVLPSFHEGLPMTILEALAAKRPVIATRVGGIPKIIREGDTGLLISPRSVSELANAISLLLNSPELRARLGESGYSSVESSFSARLMAKRYVNLYERILSTNAAA